ncbi:hypothetical protein ERO13_A05G416401v2 [Gossypium hirsutum]|uniref:Uncharacterized protein n=1 Tax=Gossypium raimondii TaxID=29730 RepID=A0A0D2V237_GOSRA|nr:hypothetical protein ERO13_A05G416401v2 [Gossypium hirsutum]KJB62945.1 hypothetical protein B456_009G456400 [Gossypium raimondii]
MSLWLFLLHASGKKETLALQDSPAMASLLQSISITLILIPQRHAIPFIVLHVFSRIACIWRTLGGPYLDAHVRACVRDEFRHSSYFGKMKSWVKI